MFIFFFNDTATTEIYTLSLHDALPISDQEVIRPLDDPVYPTGGLAILRGNLAPDGCVVKLSGKGRLRQERSEEHTSELQSRQYLVCRLLLEKKKEKNTHHTQ